MSIETAVTFEVYPDNSYHYEVHAGSEFSITYKEDNVDTGARESRAEVCFGSINEMEAVANAMLRAVQVHREMSKR